MSSIVMLEENLTILAYDLIWSTSRDLEKQFVSVYIFNVLPLCAGQ